MLSNLERLSNFLISNDQAAAAETLELIEEAVNLLIWRPLGGRPVEYGSRELSYRTTYQLRGPL